MMEQSQVKCVLLFCGRVLSGEFFNLKISDTGMSTSVYSCMPLYGISVFDKSIL